MGGKRKKKSSAKSNANEPNNNNNQAHYNHELSDDTNSNNNTNFIRNNNINNSNYETFSEDDNNNNYDNDNDNDNNSHSSTNTNNTNSLSINNNNNNHNSSHSNSAMNNNPNVSLQQQMSEIFKMMSEFKAELKQVHSQQQNSNANENTNTNTNANANGNVQTNLNHANETTLTPAIEKLLDAHELLSKTKEILSKIPSFKYVEGEYEENQYQFQQWCEKLIMNTEQFQMHSFITNINTNTLIARAEEIQQSNNISEKNELCRAKSLYIALLDIIPELLLRQVASKHIKYNVYSLITSISVQLNGNAGTSYARFFRDSQHKEFPSGTPRSTRSQWGVAMREKLNSILLDKNHDEIKRISSQLSLLWYVNTLEPKEKEIAISRLGNENETIESIETHIDNILYFTNVNKNSSNNNNTNTNSNKSSSRHRKRKHDQSQQQPRQRGPHANRHCENCKTNGHATDDCIICPQCKIYGHSRKNCPNGNSNNNNTNNNSNFNNNYNTNYSNNNNGTTNQQTKQLRVVKTKDQLNQSTAVKTE